MSQEKITESRGLLAGLLFESSNLTLNACLQKADRILGLLQPRHPFRRSIDRLLEKPAIHWDKHGTPLFWTK